MKIKERYEIFSPENPMQEIYDFRIGECDILKLQVSGAGSCNIDAYAILGDAEMEGEKISFIQDKDYDFIDSVMAPGVYTLPVEGYYYVRFVATLTDPNLTGIVSLGSHNIS